MDHTCQPLGADGATCAADEQCGFGLACVTASPSLPGTCKPLGRTGAACVLGRCAELGATCNASNQCVAVGLPGATCAAQADCSVFAECDVPNQRCVELPTLGMACDRACAGESWCNFNGQTIGTCTEPQPNGTPCEESDKCLSQNCKPGTVTESCQDYPICP